MIHEPPLSSMLGVGYSTWRVRHFIEPPKAPWVSAIPDNNRRFFFSTSFTKIEIVNSNLLFSLRYTAFPFTQTHEWVKLTKSNLSHQDCKCVCCHIHSRSREAVLSTKTPLPQTHHQIHHILLASLHGSAASTSQATHLYPQNSASPSTQQSFWPSLRVGGHWGKYFYCKQCYTIDRGHH